jgi:hypothetical protein
MRTATAPPRIASPPPKRRRRLLAAAVAACILLAAASTGVFLRERGHHPQVHLGPDTVSSLRLLWTRSIGPGPVSTTIGKTAIYVTTGDSISAYPFGCTVSGQICTPTWEYTAADGPLSAAVEQDGVVYTGSSSGLIYAFPSGCRSASCPPLWIGETGGRPLSAPSVSLDLVYVASDRLFAFPAKCGTSDQLCPPAWSADLSGAASDGPPAIGGGVVVVGSRSTSGGVTAFPAVCNARCQPMWTGRTGGPTTGVTIVGGTAYAVARGQVFAFPLGCKGLCAPSWTGPFLSGGPFTPGAPQRPAVGSGRLYVGSLDGRLWMFPLGCKAAWCAPLGSMAFGGDPIPTPNVSNGLVFLVSTAGLVSAIPDGCNPSDGSCSRDWSDVLGGSATSAPAATSTGIMVGDDRGNLYAFGLPKR